MTFLTDPRWASIPVHSWPPPRHSSVQFHQSSIIIIIIPASSRMSPRLLPPSSTRQPWPITRQSRHPSPLSLIPPSSPLSLSCIGTQRFIQHPIIFSIRIILYFNFSSNSNFTSVITASTLQSLQRYSSKPNSSSYSSSRFAEGWFIFFPPIESIASSKPPAIQVNKNKNKQKIKKLF